MEPSDTWLSSSSSRSYAKLSDQPTSFLVALQPIIARPYGVPCLFGPQN